jgi:hypothetical protein
MSERPSSQTTLEAARASLAQPLTFAEFLAKLPPKDRAAAERRMTALEATPDQTHARLWQRLACSLMTLAPFAAKLVGKQTLQIYIADGKYRMQVFALEDLQDGKFTVYCPDVLEEAEQAGLLSRDAPATPHEYVIEPSKEILRVERLDKNSPNLAAHFKDMTGWNRKALRITLPPSPSSTQVETAELLCALGARHFVHKPPVAPTGRRN